MTLRERFDIMNVLKGLPPRQRHHYSHLQLMTTEQLQQQLAAIRRAEARAALLQWAKERRA